MPMQAARILIKLNYGIARHKIPMPYVVLNNRAYHQGSFLVIQSVLSDSLRDRGKRKPGKFMSSGRDGRRAHAECLRSLWYSVPQPAPVSGREEAFQFLVSE